MWNISCTKSESAAQKPCQISPFLCKAPAEGEGRELPRGDIGDHRQGRREVVLQYLVGIDAGLVTPRSRRPFDLVVVLSGAHLRDVADVR
jgi:hypothetical protein